MIQTFSQLCSTGQKQKVHICTPLYLHCLCSAESYEKALRYEQKAVYTSSIESEVDATEHKKKRQTPERYHESESDGDG